MIINISRHFVRFICFPFQNIPFCHNKSFVVTSILLSRQKMGFIVTNTCVVTNTCLSRQTRVSFVTTKMVLVAAPTNDAAQQPQEQCYPFLSVCAVLLCLQTVIWLPVFGIFNMCTDVDACDCAQGLSGHRKRVCTES